MSFFHLLMVCVIIGCSAPNNAPKKVGENIVLQDEQEKYELIILDNGFYSWFISNARPIDFYSQSYYEGKNQQYVSSWNNLFYATGGLSPFENPINYDFGTDYGLKLNYQLFWYFQYVESLHGSRFPFP